MYLNKLWRFSLLAVLTASLVGLSEFHSESLSTPANDGSVSLSSFKDRSHSQATGATWIICTDAAWPPFEWVATDGALIGFDLDALRIIAWLEGASVAVKNIAFDNIIPSLQEGQCDMGAAAMTITAERDKIVDFSQPYWWAGDEKYGFAVTERDPKGLLSSINKGLDSLRAAHAWPTLIAFYFGSDPSIIERARSQCQGLMNQGDMSGFVNCMFSEIYPS